MYDDSTLVINQLNKDWNCTNEKMDAYCATIRKLEDKFYGIKDHHVVRANNQATNELSKLGSTWAEVPAGVFIQDLVTPSIKQGQEGVEEKPPAVLLVAAVLGGNLSSNTSSLQMSRLTIQRENASPAIASIMS